MVRLRMFYFEKITFCVGVVPCYQIELVAGFLLRIIK